MLNVRTIISALPGRQVVMRYRWELWLLFGIPAIKGAVWHLAFVPAAVFQCAPGVCLNVPPVVTGVVGLLLLVVSYRAVRRQKREFLALLWVLEIVTGVLSLLLNGVNLALGREMSIVPILFTIPIEVTAGSGSSGTEIGYPATSLAYLIITLWFARRASRISIGHAFLIVALSFSDSTFSLLYYVQFGPTPYLVPTALIRLAAQIGVNVVMFLAMIRFDASGPRARRLMITAIVSGLFLRGVALQISTWVTIGLYPFGAFLQVDEIRLWGLWHAIRLGLFVVVPLALAWLVRVPQPKRDWLAD